MTEGKYKENRTVGAAGQSPSGRAQHALGIQSSPEHTLGGSGGGKRRGWKGQSQGWDVEVKDNSSGAVLRREALCPWALIYFLRPNTGLESRCNCIPALVLDGESYDSTGNRCKAPHAGPCTWKWLVGEHVSTFLETDSTRTAWSRSSPTLLCKPPRVFKA